MLKVKGHDGLYRDDVGVIINSNKSDLDAYMQKRKKEQNTQNEIAELKAEISEIKQLLKLLIEKPT